MGRNASKPLFPPSNTQNKNIASFLTTMMNLSIACKYEAMLSCLLAVCHVVIPFVI